MRRQGAVALLAAGMLILPVAAFAQGADDMRYCAELTRLYRTYINNPEDPRPAFASPVSSHETAIGNCKAGNTAAGIPVLEKVLRDNKFDLPKR